MQIKVYTPHATMHVEYIKQQGDSLFTHYSEQTSSLTLGCWSRLCPGGSNKHTPYLCRCSKCSAWLCGVPPVGQPLSPRWRCRLKAALLLLSRFLCWPSRGALETSAHCCCYCHHCRAAGGERRAVRSLQSQGENKRQSLIRSGSFYFCSKAFKTNKKTATSGTRFKGPLTVTILSMFALS